MMIFILNSISIKSKLHSIAFDLFRMWVESARDLYPDLDFTIKDEQALVNEVSTIL
jgi:hypothetical protein